MEEKVKIISDGIVTEVYIDGVKIERLTAVRFTHENKELALIEVQTVIVPSVSKSD